MIPFGTTPSGTRVDKITLSNGILRVGILTLGAALQDVRLSAFEHSLTWGSNDLADYLGPMRHNGTLIGPIANRISTGRVTIDGVSYELERNQDGRVHLHSGRGGTHLQVWDIEQTSDTHATLSLTLPDGAAGLPGRRQISVTYSLIAPATLRMDITGTTDAATPMNFANHSFWNLDGKDSFRGHTLRIDADHFLPNTPDNCPTGDIAPVSGTQMDFRAARKLTPTDPPLDHNFCLSDDWQPWREVLALSGAAGLTMTLGTTTPGLQIYDARHADHRAIAIEAQGWPDAPTHRRFPSIVFTPDRPYRQTTTWRFERTDTMSSKPA